MQQPLIDVDSHFTDFLHAWLHEHQDELLDINQVEVLMPEIYQRFATSPMPFLNGQTPYDYFQAMRDPAGLIALMLRYLEEEVNLPELLLERIAQLPQAESHLLMLLDSPGIPEEARMLAIRLLADLGSKAPLLRYISWQLNREEKDELADFALESLEEMGEEACPAMLEALDEANDMGREALLSLLCRYPGDERVYQGLIRLFDALPERQAILAAYLARQGDERALPLLIQRAQEEETRYLDYIELRSAIEALGGEAPPRDFDRDADYDALRDLMES